MNPNSANFVPIVAPAATAGATGAGPIVISPVSYVNTLAERVYQNALQAGNIRVPSTGGAPAIAAQKKVEVDKIARKLGLRTAYAREGNLTRIATNHLTLVPPNQIYVYSLDMIRDWDPQNRNRPIPVKKQWDKLKVVNVVAAGQHLWHQHLNTNSNLWVTDGDLIWSTVPLFGLTQAAPGPLTLLDPLPAIDYRNETGDLLRVRQVQVTYDRTIATQNTPVGALFHDDTAPIFSESLPGILTRGLNAFLTRHARVDVGPGPNQNTLSGINRSFQNFVVDRLDPPQQHTVMAMQGYFLSVRPGVDRMFINMNHATSPFIEPILVSQFIRLATGLGRTMAEVQAILKGVKVSIQYNTNAGWTVPVARHRFIERVNDVSIVQQGPNRNFHPTPNVHAWYSANSPWNQHPQFPNPLLRTDPNALAVNTGKNPSTHQREVEWIPADQLMILPWQPFKGRLTGNETSAMIQVALRDPWQHQTCLLNNGQTQATIRGGLSHFGFTPQAHNAQQGFLGRVGITAGNQFVRIDARTLQAPTVMYRDPNTRARKDAHVNNASWNLANVAFAMSPLPMEELLVLRIGNASIPDGSLKMLWSQLQLHGLIKVTTALNVVTRVCNTSAAAPLSLQWEQAFEDGMRSFPAVQTHLLNQPTRAQPAGSNMGPTVLVIMQGQSYDHYACIKRVGDLKLGINTICLRGDVLRHRVLNVQKASNLALKFNIKGSASPHTLQSSSLAALRHTGQQAGIANTLVLGADVAHPTKGCLNGAPSISAVAGTVDNDFMQYRGSMRLQRGRKEEIGFLQEMVEERLIGWALTHNHCLPGNILFYRDGVSESQYGMVRTREIPQIQNAINEADRRLKAQFGGPSTAPPAHPAPTLNLPQGTDKKTRVSAEATAYRQWAEQVMAQPNNIPCNITFVVVGKRHSTRFYPTQQGGRQTPNGNCLPGLAVDSVITHPTSMDFYLQSHLPIKGTGRSAHYFVIQNGMNLSIDQLQGITHTFCYANARATRGVSYCAPAYYADKLCDRGRAYIRHLLVGRTPHTLTLCPLPPPPEPQVQTWPPRGQAQGETHEAYMNAMANLAATEFDYFRGWWQVGVQPVNQHHLYGRERKNPWHQNVDFTMFWL